MWESYMCVSAIYISHIVMHLWLCFRAQLMKTGCTVHSPEFVTVSLEYNENLLEKTLFLKFINGNALIRIKAISTVIKSNQNIKMKKKKKNPSKYTSFA